MKPYSLGFTLVLVGLLAVTAVAQGEDDEKTFLLSKLFKKYKKPTPPACPSPTLKGLYFLLEYLGETPDDNYGTGVTFPFVAMWVNAPGDGEALAVTPPQTVSAEEVDERCFVGPRTFTEEEIIRCFNAEPTFTDIRRGFGESVNLQAISFNNPVPSGEYKIGVVYFYFGNDEGVPPPVAFKLTMVKDGVVTVLSSPVPQTLKLTDASIGAPFNELFNANRANIPTELEALIADGEDLSPAGVIFTITY